MSTAAVGTATTAAAVKSAATAAAVESATAAMILGQGAAGGHRGGSDCQGGDGRLQYLTHVISCLILVRSWSADRGSHCSMSL